MIRCPRHDWVLLLLLGSGFHYRPQPVQGRLKLLGIANAIQKNWTRIKGENAAKIAVSLRQGWASRRASRGNHLRELNGIHAAAGQDLMRIPHEPKAIVSLRDVPGGDYRPLSAGRRRRLLAAPELGLGHICSRLGESILIQEDPVQSALSHEAFDFRQSLVPIEVGIVHQDVAWPSQTEHIQERKVIWVGPDRGGQGSNREADSYPVSCARTAPVRAGQRLQYAWHWGEQKNQ